MKDDRQDKAEAETFVGLIDPAGVRRPILEAAKSAVSSGRVYGRIQQLQEQKLQVRAELARTLKETRDELSKLQMVLPPREVKDTPAVLPAVKKKVLDHRLDKIESALAEIELRLKQIQ